MKKRKIALLALTLAGAIGLTFTACGKAQKKGTVDFFNGMTAVLNSVNKVNVRESRKTLEDKGAENYRNLIANLANKSKKSLSDSWGIKDADGLMEMADWLMNEGHNQEALALLKESGGTDAADRSAFEAKLKGQHLDKETCIYLLAAYDAWSAYGDGAIAAWDLSRVGSIMDFGYAAGYCTYEEAMDKTLEAAKKAQELFGS